MRLSLQKMVIKYFKGVKLFTLDIAGSNASIYGTNAAGKSTIMDAFLWLLFGKDSQGKSKFSIKPLMAAGEEIHRVDSEVYATFDIDGKKVTLGKKYMEVWKKPRGKAIEELDGHTNEFYIDEVKKTESEYASFIASIINEKLFRLLTNPLAVNDEKTFPWQERRNLLMEICGEISDEEILASLDTLPSLLQGRTVEEFRSVVKDKQKKVKDQLGEISPRINEQERSLPDIESIDFAVLPKQLAGLRQEKEGKEAELSRVRSGGEIAEKQKQISEIASNLLDIQNKHRAATGDKLYAKQNILRELQGKYRENESNIDLSNQIIESTQNAIQNCIKNRERFLTEWHAVNNLQLEYEEDLTCPTCGQALPEDKVETARANALYSHNLIKSENLERINRLGVTNKLEQEKLVQSITKLNTSISVLKSDKTALESQLTAILAEIDELKALPDVFASEEYKAAVADKATLEQAILGLHQDNQSVIEQLTTGIEFSNKAIASVESRMALARQRENGLKRIDELKAQEKTLASEYERLEYQSSLCAQYTTAKIGLLEKRINSMFKTVQWKLFDVLVNGDTRECCIACVNGVPFDSTNHGHQIIAGIEIIDVLSMYYGISVPCFVDNAEAIVRLPEVKNQMVKLYVSEADKALRVEID